MFEYLYKVRYLSVVAIICSIIGSLFMFVIGAVKTFSAIWFFSPEDIEIGRGDYTTKLLVQSVDAFLFGLILLIFSFGVYNLFIKRMTPSQQERAFWLDVRSIGHLKNTLAEVIIIILFVKFLELVLSDIPNLTWESLILPISIGILAAALKLLDLRHDAVDVARTEGDAGGAEPPVQR